MIPNTTEQSIRRRRRGVVLTPAGLKRLQEAIQAVEIAENNGDRFTLEELGDRTNVSTKTLSRLWSLNSCVDQKTLKLCFSAFNLELGKEDYTTSGELDESEAFEPSALPLNEELKHSSQTYSNASVTEKPHNEPKLSLSYPDGPVPLDSPFYIERPPLEALAYREVTQPGCLIKIRAPEKMGKSSLMLRLLSFAETQDYYTANLDCNLIDSTSLSDLNKFLRGFCLHVARELMRAIASYRVANYTAPILPNNFQQLFNKNQKLGDFKVTNSLAIRGLAISRDGTSLASVGEDNTLILWNLPRILNLDVLTYGCDRVRDYLRTNQEVQQRDTPDSTQGDRW